LPENDETCAKQWLDMYSSVAGSQWPAAFFTLTS
jgi:hypothetical protein